MGSSELRVTTMCDCGPCRSAESSGVAGAGVSGSTAWEQGTGASASSQGKFLEKAKLVLGHGKNLIGIQLDSVWL